MLIEPAIETLDGRRPGRFQVDRMYNLGSATRDPATAVAHQEEVAKVGIQIAFDVPAPRIYPIAPDALTLADEILVQGDRTSGEVEIVLIQDDQLYVGVGSDHTDRQLERVSIPWSKQLCANVLAPTVWPFAEIAAHWDECRMRCFIDGALYQDVGVAAFLRPEAILRVLEERVARLPRRGFVAFCGTIVSVSGELGFGTDWRFEMTDPHLGRTIRHGYRVTNILSEVRDGFRVPVAMLG